MKVKAFQIRLEDEYLFTDQNNLNNFLSGVVVKKIATELVSGNINFWSVLTFYDEPKIEGRLPLSNENASLNIADFSAEEIHIYNTLKQWRHDKAKQLNVPNFMICHNSELMAISKVKPQSINDLKKIKGFGSKKINKLGDDIIALLNSI
jgi:superfamily II DNA helicase RecQ